MSFKQNDNAYIYATKYRNIVLVKAENFRYLAPVR
jgi:hypothetical protein